MLSALSCEGGGHGSTHAPCASAGSGLLLQVSKLQEFADSRLCLVFSGLTVQSKICFLLLFLLVFRVGGKKHPMQTTSVLILKHSVQGTGICA